MVFFCPHHQLQQCSNFPWLKTIQHSIILLVICTLSALIKLAIPLSIILMTIVGRTRTIVWIMFANCTYSNYLSIFIVVNAYKGSLKKKCEKYPIILRQNRVKKGKSMCKAPKKHPFFKAFLRDGGRRI